jgi:hypothetical protein
MIGNCLKNNEYHNNKIDRLWNDKIVSHTVLISIVNILDFSIHFKLFHSSYLYLS